MDNAQQVVDKLFSWKTFECWHHSCWHHLSDESFTMYYDCELKSCFNNLSGRKFNRILVKHNLGEMLCFETAGSIDSPLKVFFELKVIAVFEGGENR